MHRRVFPVTMPHALIDECKASIAASTTMDGLFIETGAALPRLGEPLTVSLRSSRGREVARIDGQATWAVHAPIGLMKRGFALTVDDARTALADVVDDVHVALRASTLARPGRGLAPPIVDEGRLLAWLARRAERSRAREVPRALSGEGAPSVPVDDDAKGGLTDPIAVPPIAFDAFADAARSEEERRRAHPGEIVDDTEPGNVLSPFAMTSSSDAPKSASVEQEPVLKEPVDAVPLEAVPREKGDGPSEPRKNPWTSREGGAVELPRLVDDDEEDATLLVGPRVRALPAVRDDGEQHPFPTLQGVAFVVLPGRNKGAPSAFEKLAWPRGGTKRGMSPFPDNDDTIPLGLWSMPTLAQGSLSSDEETPDDVSDPRLIVRAAERARAIDAIVDDVKKSEERARKEAAPASAPSLPELSGDPDDESTDAALDETTADASGDDVVDRAHVAPVVAQTPALADAPVETRAKYTPKNDASDKDTSKKDASDKNASEKNGKSSEAAREESEPARAIPTLASAASSTTPQNGAIAAPAVVGDAAPRSLLVAWGAETPRVLFASDVRVPAQTVVEVPRRHLRFAEIAVFEGETAGDQVKGLLGIVRLQIAADVQGRTLHVRFFLDDDGVLAVSYAGKVVEKLRTSRATRAADDPSDAAAPSEGGAPSLVGRLKKLWSRGG